MSLRGKSIALFLSMQLLISTLWSGGYVKKVVASHEGTVLLSNGKIYKGVVGLDIGTLVNVEREGFTYGQERYDYEACITGEIDLLRKIPFSVTINQKSLIFAIVQFKEEPSLLWAAWCVDEEASVIEQALIALGRKNVGYLIDSVTGRFLACLHVFAEKIDHAIKQVREVSDGLVTFEDGETLQPTLRKTLKELKNLLIDQDDCEGRFTRATSLGKKHNLEFIFESLDDKIGGEIELIEDQEISILMRIEELEDHETDTIEINFGQEFFDNLKPTNPHPGQKLSCNVYRFSFFDESPLEHFITFETYEDLPLSAAENSFGKVEI